MQYTLRLDKYDSTPHGPELVFEITYDGAEKLRNGLLALALALDTLKTPERCARLIAACKETADVFEGKEGA